VDSTPSISQEDNDSAERVTAVDVSHAATQCLITLARRVNNITVRSFMSSLLG
jgi:hypothetical protein